MSEEWSEDEGNGGDDIMAIIQNKIKKDEEEWAEKENKAKAQQIVLEQEAEERSQKQQRQRAVAEGKRPAPQPRDGISGNGTVGTLTASSILPPLPSRGSTPRGDGRTPRAGSPRGNGGHTPRSRPSSRAVTGERDLSSIASTSALVGQLEELEDMLRRDDMFQPKKDERQKQWESALCRADDERDRIHQSNKTLRGRCSLVQHNLNELSNCTELLKEIESMSIQFDSETTSFGKELAEVAKECGVELRDDDD